MAIVTLSVHRRGLHPAEAARARYMHREEGLPLRAVRDEVLSVQYALPSVQTACIAARQVDAAKGTGQCPIQRGLGHG